jgi:predicted Fe-Mo cluster-binding NifX family protein
MKIAVTSQNRKTITGHAGKCRKFWVYDIQERAVLNKQLLELAIEQSFHESSHNGASEPVPHPLDNISVMITGGLGSGLQNRLKQKGVLAVATAETDPDHAVAAWLDGSLVEIAPELHDGHGHSHENILGQAHEHQTLTIVELSPIGLIRN